MINLILPLVFSKLVLSCPDNSNTFYTKRVLTGSISQNISVFSNFNSFTDLHSNCNRTYDTSSYLEFYPNRNLIIDETFDIEKIIAVKKINIVSQIQMAKIRGINVQNTYFKNLNFSEIIQLTLKFSEFNIYYGENLINDSTCTRKRLSVNSFLRPFKGLTFRKTIFHQTPICPFLFRDSLFQLDIGDLFNTLLIKNRLKFIKVTEKLTFLDKPIMVLHLELYYESLNKYLMNEYLFKHIRELKISHCLDQIEKGIFKELNDLKLIKFNIENLREFLNKENAWLLELNPKINISLSDATSVKLNLDKVVNIKFLYPNASFNTLYEFPNEDICLFKYLSHNSLINIEVESNNVKCTCTIVWLQLYQYLFENHNVSSSKQCNKLILNEMSCNFSKLFENCQKINQSDSHFVNDIDLLYFLKWSQFILIIILQPILCFIGLINNFLIIIIIQNKTKRKEFKETLYSHVLMNAVFNILYCLACIFNLLNTCLFFGSSVFCSRYYQTRAAQYFKIVFVIFLGNVFKLSSNITYLMFSFTRFTLISSIQEHKNTTAKVLTSRKSSLILMTITMLSSLLSIFKLFQYSVNEMDVRRDFPYETRDPLFCKNEENQFQCILFDFFKIIHKFVNDFLFIFLMLLIDFLLVRKLNQHLKKKPREIIDSDSHKNVEKSRKKIKHLIQVNLFVYFISNMPEFFSTIFLIGYSEKMQPFCQDKLSCDLINDEAQVFTLISILVQFYVFIKFDKNFKTSLKDLTARFLFKFSCWCFFVSNNKK
jgi:hypothetical protein